MVYAAVKRDTRNADIARFTKPSKASGDVRVMHDLGRHGDADRPGAGVNRYGGAHFGQIIGS